MPTVTFTATDCMKQYALNEAMTRLIGLCSQEGWLVGNPVFDLEASTASVEITEPPPLPDFDAAVTEKAYEAKYKTMWPVTFELTE